MKVYNVLIESRYDGEDVKSFIETFDTLEKALKCVEGAVQDEIQDGSYTEEEVGERLVRDGEDFFCFYHDETQSDWKFRGTVYENEVK